MTVYTWIAATLALISTVLNCKKNRLCFAFWAATNVMWIVWDVQNGIAARAVLDIVQLMLAAYGIYEWSWSDKNGKEKQ